jgi:hypothetical protein
MTRRFPLLLACVLLLVVGGPLGCPWRAGLYALQPESSFTQGCFEPCLCPILISQPIVGELGLIEVPGNEAAPFREFLVAFVHWRTKLGGEEVHITGSGRYRVGGEFALTQQLELDLRIGRGPVQHFDSGVVVGGGEFPNKLDVRISVNGEFCFDTVIDVVAAPLISSL